MDRDGNTQQEATDEALPGGALAMGGVCAATKLDGLPCQADAMPGSAYCHGHDPGHAEQRRQNAIIGNRTAGRGRPARTIEYREIKGRLADLIKRVDEGSIDTKKASVEGYLYDVLLRTIRQEEDAEAEEIRQRIEALEERIGDGRRWVG